MAFQDFGKKKWSSRGELSARSSSTLEHPKKSLKAVESLSDDEDERNSSKKRRRLFPFSSKSKKDRSTTASGELTKRSKSKEGVNKESNNSRQRAARSNTISELSTSQLQKRLSREVKPIFGMELEEAVKQTISLDGVQLPLVMRECINYVDEFGLDSPGIYRTSGIKSRIEALRNAYNLRQSVDLTGTDITVVTGLLKLYLRDLPESVLTNELNSKFEDAAAVPNDNVRLEELQAVLKELPSCNYTLLSWITVHLIHVLENSDVNKMSIQNLSIVFSPTMRISHRVLYNFFTNWEAFFGHVRLKKCRKPLQLDISGQVELSHDKGVLEEELKYHEKLLNKMHEDLNKGTASHGTEEELWGVQRIVTQIKRKLRKVKSVAKEAPAKSPDDDKSIDSLDQKSTDSKIEASSTSGGTEENKLSESDKDVKEEESGKDEVEAEAVIDEDAAACSQEDEVEEVVASPEEVQLEIKEEDDEVEITTQEAEEEEEEPLESLYLFYSELIAKQTELNTIRTELQKRIEMEKLEVARLQAEIDDAKMVTPKTKSSLSGSVDMSEESSSDSENEDELQEILTKLLEDNKRLQKDNQESCRQIHHTREECAGMRAKISIATRRSEIIQDLQDEMEKDKVKKEDPGEGRGGENQETSKMEEIAIKKKPPDIGKVQSAGGGESTVKKRAPDIPPDITKMDFAGDSEC